MEKIQTENLKKIYKKWGKQALILREIEKWKYFEIENIDCSTVTLSNQYNNEKKIFFGFVNLLNNIQKAKQLFNEIEKYCKSISKQEIIGPINYSTWFDYRLMTNGFENSKIYPEPTNPKYIPELLEQIGYKKYKTYNSILQKTNDSKLNYFKEKYEQVISNGFNIKRYKGYKIAFVLKYIYDISIDAFAENPLFSPITKKMFKKYYVSGFKKSNTKILPIVNICYKNYEPIAFSYSYINPYGKDQYVWKTTGVKKQYQKNNIGSAFRYIVHKTALENNCSNVIYHLTFEKNPVRNLLDKGKIIKEYALFSKKI